MAKFLTCLAAALGSVAAVTIAEINGDRFLSPYNGTSVKGVRGLVTAIGGAGIYLRSTDPDRNPVTSEGLYVYGVRDAASKLAVGDVVSLDGQVQEYRRVAPSNSDHLYLTELSSPENVRIVSSNNTVKPLIIGIDTGSPPTKQFSQLDGGDVLGVPNAVARVSEDNPELDPEVYGLDFWESLVGELVTVKDAIAVSRPNQYGDVWVRGDWKATGLNEHGGLTMSEGDSNPEAIVIGSPLDGSKNPDDAKMGDSYGNITGIVSYAFGFYRILPLTATHATSTASADHPAVGFESKGSCKGITVGDYNAENLSPASEHLPLVVDQIVNKLKTPDLLFLQEVQDNSGPDNDGVVTANITLRTLADSIQDASGIAYDFVEVVPDNNEDGGQPGGNIRQAYLYRPDVIELYKPNQGDASDVDEVLEGPELKYNPGRIDPENDAWDNSRKPLVAMWTTVNGTEAVFFTINVHFGSKGGSTSLHGDARPPVNKGVEKRARQAEITADFIAEILDMDPKAHVIAAGDFNEFVNVQPLKVFTSKSGLVDLDELVDMPLAERYTYLFDMNSQALDHMFVSPSLGKGALYEHLHLNTWQSYDDQVSDHDPSVARFDLCE